MIMGNLLNFYNIFLSITVGLYFLLISLHTFYVQCSLNSDFCYIFQQLQQILININKFYSESTL